MSTQIKILINGANGRMGQEAVQAITAHPNFELVGQTGREDNLAETIKTSRAQVVIDLTIPTTVFENTKIIIASNAHPVVGTSGLSNEQIIELQKRCATKKLGGIIAPNLSIGAVLMMKYAQDAAQHFADMEIIELHHNQKVDAPSGTALKTAEMMAENRREKSTENAQAADNSARGMKHADIPIHSVRLPGLVAHQQILFGADSELLTIQHDTTHRKAFMPGLCLACQKVLGLDGLIYGLEKII